jgi:hypothetical protein
MKINKKRFYYQVVVTNSLKIHNYLIHYFSYIIVTLLCPPINHQRAYTGANKKSCKTSQAYQQQHIQSGKLSIHNFNYVLLLFFPPSFQCCLNSIQFVILVLNPTNIDKIVQLIRRLVKIQNSNIKSNSFFKSFSKWSHYSNSPGEKDSENKLENLKTKCHFLLQIGLKSSSPERQTQRPRLNRNKHLKSVRKLNMANMDVDMVPETTKLNTQSDDTNNASTKKSKATSQIFVPEVEGFKWWLGFSAMEAIARDKGLPVCSETSPTADLVTFGWKEEEAKEIITAIPAYGRVPQIFYPSKREDEMLGQHYSLTHIPSEVETDEHGFSLDY